MDKIKITIESRGFTRSGEVLVGHYDGNEDTSTWSNLMAASSDPRVATSQLLNRLLKLLEYDIHGRAK